MSDIAGILACVAYWGTGVDVSEVPLGTSVRSCQKGGRSIDVALWNWYWSSDNW